MAENFKKVEQAIARSRSIAIFCHIYPDGDAIGSLLSLGLGLEKIGKARSFESRCQPFAYGKRSRE